MSAGIRVLCPHCLTRLKLKSRDMLGRRTKCPKCRELFDAAEEDEELFQRSELPPQTAGPPPPSWMTPIVPSSVPRRRRQSKQRPNKLVPFVAGSVLTAIVVSACFVPWWSYIEDINLNPFADTPDSIMAAVPPLFRELADRLEAAQDGQSLQETAVKVKQVDQKVVDLYLRAVRVSPVSRERLDSISAKHRKEVEEATERMKDLFLRGRSRSRTNASAPTDAQIAGYGDLKSTAASTVQHLQYIVSTFKTLMEKPPAAQSKPQKTGLEMIGLLRKCAVAVSRVDSSSAASSARQTLEDTQQKLETLKQRLIEETAGQSAETVRETFVYEGIAQGIRQEIVQVAQCVGERCTLGSDFDSALSSLCPLQAMRRGLLSARPALQPQVARASPQAAEDDSEPPNASPALPQTPPKHTLTPNFHGQAALARSPLMQQPFPQHPAISHPAIQQQAIQQPFPQQQVPQQPFTHAPLASAQPLPGGFPGFGRGPLAATIDEPPFVPPATDEPQGFLAKCLHDFGKDNVVFLGFIDSDIPPAIRKRILKAVEAVAGKVAARWSVNRGTILAVKTSMDTDELAARIVLGRVRKVDVGNRRMSIDLHAISMPDRTWLHGFPAQRPLGSNGVSAPHHVVTPQGPSAPGPNSANPNFRPSGPPSASPRGATGL